MRRENVHIGRGPSLFECCWWKSATNLGVFFRSNSVSHEYSSAMFS